MEILLEHEAALRDWALFGPVSILLVWEAVYPRRALNRSILLRWLSNITVAAIDGALLRWLLPALIIGVAASAQASGWGLLNHLGLPSWLGVAACLLALDLSAYALHRVYHRLPVCWRFHRMHHTDQDVDWSTGIRFHPFEALVTKSVMMLVVVILGLPPVGILLSAVLVLLSDVFQHGNIVLPRVVDRWLRRVMVTPDMHRVHHSVIQAETDSNYGVVFPWWDRLFDTYKALPEKGHSGMTVGLKEFGHPRHINVLWMLALPFLSADAQAARPGLPVNAPPASKR